MLEVELPHALGRKDDQQWVVSLLRDGLLLVALGETLFDAEEEIAVLVEFSCFLAYETELFAALAHYVLFELPVKIEHVDNHFLDALGCH